MTVSLQRPIPRVISRPGKVLTTVLSRPVLVTAPDIQTRQPPQGPAWPRGNYLPDVRAFPL